MTNPSASPAAGSPPGPPDPAPRKQLLLGVAQALRVLAERLVPQTDAMQDVYDFVVRAEEMAEQARQLGAARVPDTARAAALAADFESFIAEAAELSRRAAQEAAISRELSGTMAEHAGGLAQMAAGPESHDLASLRARLRPVMTTLEALPARLAAGAGMAADVAALGTRAAELGTQAMAVQQHRVSAAEKALAICRSLRTLAGEAATIAETLRADTDRLRNTIGGVVTQVGRMSAPAPAKPVGAEARMGQVVAQGARAAPSQSIDWGVGRPRQ